MKSALDYKVIGTASANGIEAVYRDDGKEFSVPMKCWLLCEEPDNADPDKPIPVVVGLDLRSFSLFECCEEDSSFVGYRVFGGVTIFGEGPASAPEDRKQLP